MSDADELDLVVRRLNAERYGRSRWWVTTPDLMDDSEVTTARRRRVLAEAWGESETPVVERDSRKSTVDSETKRGPDRANESDPLATISTIPKGA